jgi:methyl-accepting chemotaxis protein
MGIRVKILLGFFILASMLFISGAFSIFELTKQGQAVKMMITDSYRSIDYSKQMLDAMEQQEKILLRHIGNNTPESFEKFEEAAKFFELNLDSARKNLTFPHEEEIVDSITKSYFNYKEKAQRVFFVNGYNLNAFLDTIHPAELQTTKYIKKLTLLNQQELYDSAAFHEASAQRAIVPGLVVILTSLIFTFIFTYLVNHYFVSPIIKLTKGINDYVKFHKPFDVPLETRDEIYKLKTSIKEMISLSRLSNKPE